MRFIQVPIYQQKKIYINTKWKKERKEEDLTEVNV